MTLEHQFHLDQLGIKRIDLIDNLPDLLKAMEICIGKSEGKPINLPYTNLVIRPETLETIFEHLQLPFANDRVQKRLADHERMGSSDPKLAALAEVLGGQLVVNQVVERGPLARDNAYLLIETLTGKSKRLSLPMKDKIAAKADILTEELLDETMYRCVWSASPGAIADQLEDPFRMANLGLVVKPVRRPTDLEDRGFGLPVELLEVLEKLKDPESGDVLKQWIVKNISDYPREIITFLRTIAQFTFLLDSRSLVELYYSSEKKGEIPLLPFQSLYTGVVAAMDTLKRYEGFQEIGKKLTDIADIIIMRFHQIITGDLKDQVSVIATDLVPKIDDVVIRFLIWDSEHPGLSPLQKARHAVRFIEQIGVNPLRFYEWMSQSNLADEKMCRLILKELVTRNIVEPRDQGLLNEIMLETLQRLVEQPWLDVIDHDFSNIIKPNTEVLQIFLVHGTFGPITRGHIDDYIGKTFEYINFMEDLEGPDSNIQRLVIISPITDSRGIPNYPKDAADIGPCTERVEAMMIGLAHLDRERVFITTQLQPLPRGALTIERSINAIGNQITAKISRDLAQAEQIAGLRIEVHPCFGFDEFIWTPDGLAEKQKSKVRGPSLAVGRFGHLIAAIKSAEAITKYTGSDLILSPGVAQVGSSRAVENIIKYGYTKPWPITLIPFIQKHWNSRAIFRRRSITSEEILSVTEISKRVVIEYAQLLRESGIKLN